MKKILRDPGGPAGRNGKYLYCWSGTIQLLAPTCRAWTSDGYPFFRVLPPGSPNSCPGIARISVENGIDFISASLSEELPVFANEWAPKKEADPAWIRPPG